MLLDAVLIDCSGLAMTSSGRSTRLAGVSGLGGSRICKGVRRSTHQSESVTIYLFNARPSLKRINSFVNIFDNCRMLNTDKWSVGNQVERRGS